MGPPGMGPGGPGGNMNPNMGPGGPGMRGPPPGGNPNGMPPG